MANGVNELIDQLYTMISDAWGLPLGAEKCVIERNSVLDLLDEIKVQLPMELAEAKRLMSYKNEFVQNARDEAEQIRQQAADDARKLLEKETIVRAAKQRADEIIDAAEKKTAELRRAASAYADDILRRTEGVIGESLENVRKSRASFRSASGIKSEYEGK